MARYSVYTKLDPEEVIRRAVAFFGEGGVGLQATEQASCCATFEGGGGHVAIAVDAGERTEVELETREWDHDVKRFMQEIA
ncbi:MAG: hypothetical protein ACK2UX_16095 [Anaerolineae bacterium]|jgi:hypothetical protein